MTTTIIVAYAPTESVDTTEKDTYYSQLRSAIESVSLHDFLAILPDLLMLMHVWVWTRFCIRAIR